MHFELQYKKLIRKILNHGEVRETRNGKTKALFGKTLTVDLTKTFPILTSRKMYYKGVFGELAAMLRQPKHIDDFKAQGCNYWDLWSKDDGSINIDYGNKWLDWDGVNQLENVLEKIKTNPTDRRLLVSGWDPRVLDDLDLPCCHYSYQWYVREGKYLDMLWHQRSADVMIGIPSDIVFAAAWLISMSNEVKLKPSKITFTFGDTHIYEEHEAGALEYLSRPITDKVRYAWVGAKGKRVVDFKPSDIELIDYDPEAPIKFKLKE